MSAPAKQIPKPETKKKADVASAAKPSADALAVKKRELRIKVKRSAVQRAAKYAREYKSAERTLIASRRSAKEHGNFFREAGAKVGIVTRIRGINQVTPKEAKILRLLRLRRVFSATFVKLNKATLAMLQRVNPYISWGYLTPQTVRKLIYKRGFLKLASGRREKLVDNAQVHKAFGKLGLVCAEDIVHEIATCGPNFTKVNRGLWPFRLSAPRGGLRMKRRHFVEGGAYGNREEYMNAFVNKML